MLDAEPMLGGRRGPKPISGLTPERLGWLIRLRWIALLGIVIAGGLAAAGAFPGVNWQVLFSTAAGAAFYNASMWRDLRQGRAPVDQRAATYQALIDFLLLTIVLWAAGGLRSPFVSYYVFHVAVAGILSGPRASVLAGGFALMCAGLLWLTEGVPGLQIGSWNPQGLWDQVASVAAFVSTVGAVAYLVTHAVAEIRDRERALEEARNRAELEYELLSTTLNELDAGLEVLDPSHVVVFRNRLAKRLIPRLASGDPWHCPGTERACERDASGLCPIERSFDRGEAGRCRFAVDADGIEHVYELLSFPLSADPGQQPRVMNLYLDRTSATIAERQLVLAERLASLGRVVQGVAHELNTPLATIRTLAADMVAALRSLDTADPDARGRLAGDLAESASLIKEETARLGRIAQELLAGGDLVRLRVLGAVPLGAVVERAAALVFAGVRGGGPSPELDASLDGMRLRCDQDRLVQVLVNLLQNAHDALKGKRDGRVRVSAQRNEEGLICIAVEDDGSGVDPRVAGRLFEPFTTTKPPGEGTGLGLYTSYMLVKAMHGSLALEPRAGGGTRALLTLPLDGERPAAGALPVREAAS